VPSIGYRFAVRRKQLAALDEAVSVSARPRVFAGKSCFRYGNRKNPDIFDRILKQAVGV
jgi:hypothetical protein